MINEIMNGWGWRYSIRPILMGIFFGLGHFLSYLIFSRKTFTNLETRFNSFLKDYMP